MGSYWYDNRQFAIDMIRNLSEIHLEADGILTRVSKGIIQVKNTTLYFLPRVATEKCHVISYNSNIDYIREIVRTPGFDDPDFESFLEELEDELDNGVKEIIGKRIYGYEDCTVSEAYQEYCNQAFEKEFPYVMRHGHNLSSDDETELMVALLRKKHEGSFIFVSDAISYSSFFLIFVVELDKSVYLKCRKHFLGEKKLRKRDQSFSVSERYEFFIDNIMKNLLDKWSNMIYYGLDSSTIGFIAGHQAIISASANDVLMSRRLPDQDFITYISNQLYEGEICNGQIVFGKECDIRFEDETLFVRENVRKIRKILELSSTENAIVVDVDTNNIIGVSSLSNYKDTCVIRFGGKNTWSLFLNESELLCYTSGEYTMPIPAIEKEEFMQKMEGVFGEEYNTNLYFVVKTLLRQKHGTMLVVSKNAARLTKVITTGKRGYSLEEVDICKCNESLILDLSAIDGAIMVNPFGICKGIGLILPNVTEEMGNTGRGARYNAALGFVNAHEDTLAIVFSEDGTVDILTKAEKEKVSDKDAWLATF